ncbi:ABC transporter [Colletotrichum somersetense]|nr:ABC transporter [Colletotrichum somersetense]
MWVSRPACPPGQDDSLGPWAGDDCRGGFNLTLLSEEAVLAVVASTLRHLKTSASICLVALDVALLALCIATPSHVFPRTRATIPTAVLSLLASLGVGLLSWLSHEWSLRPSFVLSIYLFLSTLLDTARARTLAVMVLLESTEKRRILVPRHKGYSKEVTSGTFNRSVFFWLTLLFVNGYRNILRLDDLYPLDPELASGPVYRKLADAWNKVPDKTVPGALFRTWLCTFAGPASAPIVPKLFQIAFNYALPFLIDESIRLASQPQTRLYNNRGFGLIGAYPLVYTGIAVSTGQYDWRNQRTASITRGSTTALVYRKALILDLSHGITHLHEVWGGLLEIGIGIYLIYRQLGAACAMPVVLVFVVLFATAFFAIPTGKASTEGIKASQDRVSTTSKTLGSIKWLKSSGLSGVAFSVIQKLRVTELDVSRRFRVLLGVSMIIRTRRHFDTSKAFTAYSLLILVNQLLVGVIMGLPLLAARPDRKTVPSQHLELLGLQKKNSVPLNLTDNVIASVKGTFSWSEDSKPVIDIDNWNIKRGALTLVLGPVGCGKSTLLKALLSELSSFNGTIRTNLSGIAYCSQTAWIPNDMIRNVIVGFAAFDPAWYQTVIKACALEQNISNWPQGENTVTGSKGISMSGGEKHRLAIARALFAREELLLLYNFFSGLDSGTEDIVFNALFGSDGLLGDTDTTVVLTSSDTHRLSFADEVIVISEGGQIVNDTTAGRPARDQFLGKKTVELNNFLEAAPRQAESYDDRPPAVLLGVLEDQADATRQLGDWGMYNFYAKAAGWFSLTAFAGAMVVFAFCDSFPDIWLKWWAESNETRPNQHLGKWLGVYAALGVGSVVFVLFGMWQLFIVIINRSGTNNYSAPMLFHSSTDSGVTVNRFSQDLQLINMELPSAALGLAIGAAFGVARFIMISVSSRYMAAILPLLIPVFYAIQHFYLRTSRQVRLLDIENKAPLYSQLIETLEGLATVRAFRWEDDFEKINLHRLDNSQRPSYLLTCLQRWLTFSVDMVIAAIAIVLMALVTTLREQIGPGFIGVALTNVLSFGGIVKAIITSWVTLEVSLGAVARVRNFTLTTRPEGGSETHLAEPEGGWPSRGAIEICGATASYSSFGPVLKGVDLSIQPGQKVAICGRTGSGKSSLILCLLRMMELDAGSITIDGVDVSTLPHEYIRSKLVAVPQESYIFDGTVRLNLDPTETTPDSEVVTVLEKVQLWAKVAERGGLDAVIDDTSFSQGEAQLLVLARAMLRKGKVLMLGEISSSLNEESSRVVDEVLRTWFHDWTVIVIAHKLESILEFDRVAVVDAGVVVEYDEPQRLLDRASSFKALYELSSRPIS